MRGRLGQGYAHHQDQVEGSLCSYVDARAHVLNPPRNGVGAFFLPTFASRTEKNLMPSFRHLPWFLPALLVVATSNGPARAWQASILFATGPNPLIVKIEGRKGTRLYRPDESEAQEKATAEKTSKKSWTNAWRAGTPKLTSAKATGVRSASAKSKITSEARQLLVTPDLLTAGSRSSKA